MKDRIREIRKEIGVTQPEFAELTGKTRDSISNIELGRVRPDDTFIMLLHEKYGYSLDWIRTGEGEKKVPTPYWEAGAAFTAKAMQQSVAQAREYLKGFFQDWPDEDVLLACALMQKHFRKENNPADTPPDT